MTKESKKDQDLTRIENLSEFIHEEDTQIDRLFDSFNLENSSNNEFSNDENEETSRIYNLDELEDSQENSFENNADYSNEEEFSELETNTDIETEIETASELYDLDPYDDNSTEFNNEVSEFSEFSYEDQDIELNAESEAELDAKSEAEFEADFSEEVQELISEEDALPPPIPFDAISDEKTNYDLDNTLREDVNEKETFESSSEFNDDKNIDTFSETKESTKEHYSSVTHFANNLNSIDNYIAEANPPYSILINEIEFIEDSSELIKTLEEFDVINDDNKNNYIDGINTGRILIPQISEYKAILLGHALRKFNFNITIGLSHEVRPDSSDLNNFRGLINKKFTTQNVNTSYMKNKQIFSIEDIHISTLKEIDGLEILKCHDVKNIMSVITIEELNRLAFVEESLRNLSHIQINDYFNESVDETIMAYKTYQKSFDQLFNDMIERLKNEAFERNINAIIDVQFKIIPMFNDFNDKISSYTITCSATFATVTKES